MARVSGRAAIGAVSQFETVNLTSNTAMLEITTVVAMEAVLLVGTIGVLLLACLYQVAKVFLPNPYVWRVEPAKVSSRLRALPGAVREVRPASLPPIAVLTDLRAFRQGHDRKHLPHA